MRKGWLRGKVRKGWLRGHGEEEWLRGHAEKGWLRGHGEEGWLRGHGVEGWLRGHGVEGWLGGHGHQHSSACENHTIPPSLQHNPGYNPEGCGLATQLPNCSTCMLEYQEILIINATSDRVRTNKQ